MFVRRLAVPLALVAALAVSPTALALKSGTYKGKNKQGYKVSFKVSHNKIKKVKSYVSALCAEYGGDYRKVKNGKIRPDQHSLGGFRYVLRGGTKGDKKVKGRLDLHYEINSSGYALHYTFCTVETKFMAKWKKK